MIKLMYIRSISEIYNYMHLLSNYILKLIITSPMPHVMLPYTEMKNTVKILFTHKRSAMNRKQISCVILTIVTITLISL